MDYLISYLEKYLLIEKCRKLLEFPAFFGRGDGI